MFLKDGTGMRDVIACGNMLFITCFLSLPAEAAPDSTRSLKSFVVDTFTSRTQPKNHLPEHWHASRGDVSMVSLQSENGNYFTRFDDRGGCTSIAKQCSYSLDNFPILSWKWRIHVLPEHGREKVKSRNDSGASVYVIFKGILKLNTILKYVWSSSLPVGTVLPSPYNSKARIIVIQSGSSKKGQWVTERTDVRRDYLKAFGRTAPPVEGIALLSDSDNTRSTAMADYDDILLLAE
jgi:hypothetical protein